MVELLLIFVAKHGKHQLTVEVTEAMALLETMYMYVCVCVGVGGEIRPILRLALEVGKRFSVKKG